MASPAKIVERIRSLGANLMLDGGKLRIVNREKLPAAAIGYVRENAEAIAAFLDREAEFEERAAIMEYDGHLRRADAEYLAKLLLSSPPAGADPADWSWFVLQASHIVERGIAA